MNLPRRVGGFVNILINRRINIDEFPNSFFLGSFHFNFAYRNTPEIGGKDKSFRF